MRSTFGAVLGPFEEALLKEIAKLGGADNAHAHLDRARTLDPKYYDGFNLDPLSSASDMTLRQKQSLTGELHVGPAYAEADLARRIGACIEDSRPLCRSVVSFIDATPDIGTRAIKVAAKLRRKYLKQGFNFRFAAHPIFGFKADSDHEVSRWDNFVECCQIADIVGSLPEKDDRHDSIGYIAHMRDTLNLAIRLGKPYQAHVDQANLPSEEGTEQLVECVKWLGSPRVARQDRDEPTVWAIHAISPSCYDEARFSKLVDGMVKHNIGLIVCPRAALSMKQHRDETAPVHNSIARVLEMASRGVRVRVGTDNLADVFVPSYSSMLGEIGYLAEATRFYDVPTLSRFAAGKTLNATNRSKIERHLG